MYKLELAGVKTIYRWRDTIVWLFILSFNSCQQALVYFVRKYGFEQSRAELLLFKDVKALD